LVLVLVLIGLGLVVSGLGLGLGLALCGLVNITALQWHRLHRPSNQPAMSHIACGEYSITINQIYVLLLLRRTPLSQTYAVLPSTLRRRQFPVRPAFIAMTIKKAQDQTLQSVKSFLLMNQFLRTGNQLNVVILY